MQLTFDEFSTVEYKVCITCGESKPVTDYRKWRRSCKVCANKKGAARRRNEYPEQRDKILARSKIYHADNIDKINAQRHGYYMSHADVIKRKSLEYYHSNKEKCQQTRDEYYNTHKIDINEHKRNYYYATRAARLKQYKEYRERNKERLSELARIYMKSPNGRLAKRKVEYRRKDLGYSPLNEWFEGSEYHHLHVDLNGNPDKAIGVYLPKEIHQSIWHNGENGHNLDIINKLALEWHESTKCVER